MRRIVFSNASFRMKLPVQSTPTSTKSRWKFYMQVGRRSFHTGWTQTGPRQAVSPGGSCVGRRARDAAMDVGGWLRRLGLEQYEASFRENEISEKVLPNLTAEDLKDLGVGIVGHRRMLIDAIATLRTGTSALTPLSDAPPATPTKPAKDSAERRQVTVMFSDLVGSTALSARMDPEDLREVISAYQKCVAEIVRRCDGFVAKYMGDGVLVYFGYPLALFLL